MLTDETTFVWDSAPFLVAGVCFTSEISLSYKILLMYKNHRFGKWKNIAYNFVHFFVSIKCMTVFRCRLGCSTCPTDLDLLFWCHPFFSLSATCLSQKAISCASTWHLNRWNWSNISILLACTLSLFTLLLTEGAARKSAWARSISFLNRASASRSQCCPTYERLLSAVTTSVYFWTPISIVKLRFLVQQNTALFSTFRPSVCPPSSVKGLTYQLFSIFWRFIPWKPYIFWMHII